MCERVVKSPGVADEDLMMKHSRVLAATGAFASGQCGRNARRGRRRERGCSDGRPEGEGVGNGAAQVEGQKEKASGRALLRWKAGGGRHWKRGDEGGVSEKRTTRKQMRRWQIVQK